jgi:hypothetical protein
MNDPIEVTRQLFDREVKELLRYPFFPLPTRVKILMVTDGSGSFDSSASFGLGRAIEILQADPWWWVKFEITTAHRNAGPAGSPAATAQHQSFRFDAPPAGLSLSDFQEIWLFGVLPDGSAPILAGAELAALSAFMDADGGVFATGDHDSLGASLSSEVPRVRKMRRWKPGGPAGTPPLPTGVDRHDTTREGPTPGFQFDDQSDNVPQVISPRMYFGWSPFPWRPARHPHPVLCGRHGIINVLPDHMHEGEIVVPASIAGDPEFPGGIGPEVIATATVIPHTNTDGFGPVNGKTFGVLGAYDGHRAKVGRIVVDATWHHWFNINLMGFTSGEPAFEQIKNYFWNVALWLAPPPHQHSMFDKAVHGLPYVGPLRELSPALPVEILGAAGLDAIGRRASQCTIRDWILWRLPPRLRELIEFPKDPNPPDPPYRGPYMALEFALGGVLREALKLGSASTRRPRAPRTSPWPARSTAACSWACASSCRWSRPRTPRWRRSPSSSTSTPPGSTWTEPSGAAKGRRPGSGTAPARASASPVPR